MRVCFNVDAAWVDSMCALVNKCSVSVLLAVMSNYGLKYFGTRPQRKADVAGQGSSGGLTWREMFQWRALERAYLIRVLDCECMLA